MQRFLVQKVGIGSLGKLVGTWFAILGFATGIISSLVAIVTIFDKNYSTVTSVLYAALATIALLVIYPVVWFLIGWLQGALLALIFNIIVSNSGGLSVHMEETKIDGTPLEKIVNAKP